jgi:hypothetical protein
MIRIREVEDKDLNPLSVFLPQGFPSTTKEFWLPLFEWWWSINPAYTKNNPRGWVLEKDEKILGFIGNIPVKYLVNGVETIASASNSWYVDPSVRGIFSFIVFNEFLKQKSSSIFLFKGEDNKHIMHILSKYKFEEHILPKNQKDYVYIINKKKMLYVFKTFLLNYQMPRISQSFEYVKRAVFLFFGYLHQKPLDKGENFPKGKYVSSVCTSCDDSFSKLWEPWLKTCDITVSRDPKTLNWLYFSSAGLTQRVVFQCHRTIDKTLAGYMVFDLIPKKTSELGSMHLMDICIEKNDPQVLASLTSFAIEFGKQHHRSLLVVCVNNKETETYFRNAFSLSRTVHYYRYIKYSPQDRNNSGKNIHGTVCLPLIYPPQ